jgi:hypothetical protein
VGAEDDGLVATRINRRTSLRRPAFASPILTPPRTFTLPNRPRQVHTQVHTRSPTCSRACACVHTDIDTDTHTHTHTHTHTPRTRARTCNGTTRPIDACVGRATTKCVCGSYEVCVWWLRRRWRSTIHGSTSRVVSKRAGNTTLRHQSLHTTHTTHSTHTCYQHNAHVGRTPRDAP